jgi:ABC-type glycerol-3-phosphate transport system permease component
MMNISHIVKDKPGRVARSGGNSQKIIGKSISTMFMAATGVLILVPFIWMLSASFKLPVDLYKFPVEWIPKSWTFNNYNEVWFKQDPPFYVYYLTAGQTGAGQFGYPYLCLALE